MGMVAAAIGLVIGAGGATALRIIQNHHPPSPSIVGAAAPKLPALAQFGAVPTTPSSTLGPVQLTAQPGLPVGGVDIASRATVTGPPEPPPGNDDPPGFGPFTPQSTVDGAKGGWRVPGDASGDTLTLTFPAPVTFRAVGLDPGDDAVGPDGSDLWPTRRAVSQATFTFDDGSSVIVTFTTDASTPPSERLLLAYLQAPETSATIKIHIDSTQSALEAGFPDQTVITRIAVLGA